MSKIDFEKVLAEAHKAASDAQIDAVDAWACGFAWVTIDGNDPLARHCRKMAKALAPLDFHARRFYGDKGYPRGWQFWGPGNFRGQSVDAHEKGAVAFRNALGAHGIRADVNSRLD